MNNDARWIFLSASFCCACAPGPGLRPGESITTYSLPDWPTAPQPGHAYNAKTASISTSSATFHVEAPPGYQPTAAILAAPVQALFAKPLISGEATLLVERYSKSDGNALDKDVFLAQAKLGASVKPIRREYSGSMFLIYENIEKTKWNRLISPNDPYADRLGSSGQPPRLGWMDPRRFPVGGEAYRFYRCRKRGAWNLLKDYRRARQRETDLDEFRSKKLDASQRQILIACFGQDLLSAMAAGQEISAIPEPRAGDLRAMALEEWTWGASQAVEIESLYLKDIPDGFYALRLRGPKDAYEKEQAAFLRFISSFNDMKL